MFGICWNIGTPPYKSPIQISRMKIFCSKQFGTPWNTWNTPNKKALHLGGLLFRREAPMVGAGCCYTRILVIKEFIRTSNLESFVSFHISSSTPKAIEGERLFVAFLIWKPSFVVNPAA